MAVDGAAPHQIDQVLTQEIDAIQDIRHRHVVCCVGPLKSRHRWPDRHSDRSHPVARQPNDPGSIGPSMAVALLTTFYGAILAYMVLAPIAAKLEHNAEAELLECEITTRGSQSPAGKPTPLERMINTNCRLPSGWIFN